MAEKFRKKPVEVEAVQFVEGKPGVVIDFLGAAGLAVKDGNKVVFFRIETIEGVMRAEHGDWIIKGIAGEFYPCKPDIFEQTYEPVRAH